MNFSLVSILIPAYNHEVYILKCLDSVLEDPYPVKELVIINDGSIDATNEKILEWIAKHKNTVPVNYISRKNKGICATMNELVSMANGEFLKLGASDDYFIPGGIQAQVNYLKENHDKLAVISDFIVVNDKGDQVYGSGMLEMHKVNKNNYLTNASIKKEIISNWAISGATPMIKKSYFQVSGGWDETLRIDDWDFFLKLVSGDYLGFVDKKVCAYRLHQNNTCKPRNNSLRILNWLEVERVAKSNMVLFTEPFRKMLKAQIYLARAKMAFVKRNPFGVFNNMFSYWVLNAVANHVKDKPIDI